MPVRAALAIVPGTHDAPSFVMQHTTARACLETLAASGLEPALRGVTGVCELDLQDAAEKDRRWSIRIDDGRLTVSDAAVADDQADARLHMRESDFVELALGKEHENLLTAVLRGRLRVEGDLRFAQCLQLLLPLRDGGAEKGIAQ